MTKAPEEQGARRLDPLLRAMVQHGASDLHLATGLVPMIRVDGRMLPLPNGRAAGHEALQAALVELMPELDAKVFFDTNDTDFGYEVPGLSRFRCNVFLDRRGVAGVVRVIPSKIPTMSQLALPESIQKLCFLSKGLILVTGPTGSGKSTTLAAMLDFINDHRSDHIITIEDPIEFVYDNKKCHVNQREVGRHTDSFKSALRAALREDPDIILIGELRDLETAMIAIETAETGHLVFGTLHTNSAVRTVDRLIGQFPGEVQEQVRMMLSESLMGVISQTLCRKKGSGRIAALEILLHNRALATLIREGKTYQIPSTIQTGRKQGMQQMGEVLLNYVRQGFIDSVEAVRCAPDKEEMLVELSKMGLLQKSG